MAVESSGETPVIPTLEYIQRSRQEISQLKEQLAEQRQQLFDRIQHLENKRQAEVLAYLGVKADDPLALHATGIVQYALEKGVDPRWLFQEASFAATQVESEATSARRRPETAYDYYMLGLFHIASQNGNDTAPRLVNASDAFKKAIEISQQENTRRPPVDPKRSPTVIYTWADENIGLLHAYHVQYFWEHY